MRKIPFPGSALLSVLAYVFIDGCAPTMSPVNPPVNYKGPVAEGPKLQAGDYWIYERADGRRMKAGAGTFFSHLGFPLWVGKTWKYPSEATRRGHDPATSSRIPAEIECEVIGFKETKVTAGTFDSFECKCRCEHFAGSQYESGCGEWTVWYAPKAKNIIRIKTESTATTAELVEYDVSGKVARPTPFRRDPPQCLDPESRKRFPILCRSY